MSSDFTIKQTKHGLTITEVNNKNIEVLNVPEGITYIGNPDAIEYIFYDCKNLKEVHLPSTLQRIELYAFNDCEALKKINVPEGVEYIGDRAFEDCKSLTEIYLPNSVKEIGAGAFCACSKLRKIHLPENITELPESLFFGCKEMDFDKFEIPASVTKLGPRIFGSTGIKSFKTPEAVTSIGYEAFMMCPDLTELYIGENITEVGCNLFGQEIHEGLRVSISPNIVKTDIFSPYDTTLQMLSCYKQFYKITKDGIMNLTLNQMLEDEKWEPGEMDLEKMKLARE